ncbi:MAG: hypothetical protein K2Q12_11175 [Rickettsiales bacterium]|nr:hypothetical protein [Rickettsiales bacterium]
MAPFTPISARIAEETAERNRKEKIRQELATAQSSLRRIQGLISTTEVYIREAGTEIETLRGEIEQLPYHATLQALKKRDFSAPIYFHKIVEEVVTAQLEALVKAVESEKLFLHHLPEGHTASEEQIIAAHEAYNKRELEYKEKVIAGVVAKLEECLEPAKKQWISMIQDQNDHPLANVTVDIASHDVGRRTRGPYSYEGELIRIMKLGAEHESFMLKNCFDSSHSAHELVNTIDPFWVLQESFAKAMQQLGCNGSLEAGGGVTTVTLKARMNAGDKEAGAEYARKNAALYSLRGTVLNKNTRLTELAEQSNELEAKIVELESQLGTSIAR